ncbi:MAG: exosome complex RNA-binding protein Rrp4 [Promethearchaeota archaeon]
MTNLDENEDFPGEKPEAPEPVDGTLEADPLNDGSPAINTGAGDTGETEKKDDDVREESLSAADVPEGSLSGDDPPSTDGSGGAGSESSTVDDGTGIVGSAGTGGDSGKGGGASENGQDTGSGDETDAEGGEGTRNRDIVTPGTVVGTKDGDNLPGRGTIADENKNIIALYVGFLQKRGKYLNVIPFKGPYLPHVGDKVIGKIYDKNVVLYKLDINSPYIAILKPSDDARQQQSRDRGRDRYKSRTRSRSQPTTSKYSIGDIVIGMILKFDRTTEPSMTTVGPDLGPIKGGFLTEIAVPKIPRLIGKNGSMIKLLNNLTGCRVFVAQNGVVWVKGRDPRAERVVMKAVKLIEREAHTFGLTDRVKEFISGELNN